MPGLRDIRVDKQRMSGSWDTPLGSILRDHRVETLLAADCAATTNPRFCHDAAILDIHQIPGLTPHSTDLAKAIAP